jgi:SAM-dependent methyltransferase
LAHQLLPRDISVLDLFCGNGYGSFLLAETREVTGIDGSAPAIEVADRCFKRSGNRFASCCYPFEDGSEYDAIVSYESIEHVPDGGEFFRFLVQHLRPGGWLLYSTPNENLLPFNRNVHIHHHRHYTHGETLEFARSAGLMIEDWYGQDVYKSITAVPPALLAEDDMELKRGLSGQFTVVVARKPTARAA